MRPRISGVLLYWLLRQTLPVTVIFSVAAVLSLLLYDRPLNEDSTTALLFIIAHCVAIMFFLGRSRAGWFAFIHTRGFSRTMLACHYMLAAGLAAFMIWCPAVLLVVTNLRAYIQDHLFKTPYSVILPDLERYQPLIWFGMYAILLPVFQYAWIRKAQPTRGLNCGIILAALWTLACIRMLSIQTSLIWYAGIIVALATLVGSIRLYCRMEVRA